MTAAFDGSPAPDGWYHVGHPMSDADILARVKKGLVPYVPTDPRVSDQAANIAFAARRGPNSE